MSAKIYLRKFGRGIATVLFAIVASGGVIVGVTRFFTIATIEVEGAGMQVIVDQKKLAKNLLFFPGERLRQELLSTNPLLGDVQIRKKFPHTLVIVALPRTAIGRLQANGRLVDMDREGWVIRDGVPDGTLPTLIFDIAQVRVGEKIKDTNVQQGLAAIGAFQPFLAIDTITPLDSESLQVKSGKTSIYITQNGNIQETAATLQTLLTGFRIRGTLPAVIDLRFTKPVVSF